MGQVYPSDTHPQGQGHNSELDLSPRQDHCGGHVEFSKGFGWVSDNPREPGLRDLCDPEGSEHGVSQFFIPILLIGIRIFSTPLSPEYFRDLTQG